MRFDKNFSITGLDGKRISLKEAFEIADQKNVPAPYDPEGKFNSGSFTYCSFLLYSLRQFGYIKDYETLEIPDVDWEYEEGRIY